MHRNIPIVVGITILFLGTCITPSIAIDTNKESSTPISNGNTLYVGGTGPNNHKNIQDAIDNASDGDTIFVYEGIYREHITIKKRINLIGENRKTTIIQGKNEDVDLVYVEANKVNISYFTIQYSTYLKMGIYILESNDNSISNCDLRQIISMDAICLRNSFNNRIINCSITDSAADICIAGSQGNIVSNCSLKGSKSGIDIIDSSNNVISNCYLESSCILISGSEDNIISNCKIFNHSTGGSYGIQISYSTNCIFRNNSLENLGIIFNVNFPYEYYHDIDTSNTIDGKPIYYILEDNNREFNETMDIGYIGLISCENITVKNLSLHGAVFGNTSFSTIENCYFYENLFGVEIGLSTNNIIRNCDFYTYRSIRFRKSSDNIVSNCRMPIGGKYGVGVDINYYSNRNTISNCSIANFDIGIIIGGESHDNTITGCNISYNDYWGIWLCSSDNNITKNTIRFNVDSGILIYLTSSNIISYNILESNLKGICCYSSSFNEISFNTFKSNDYGVLLNLSANNNIIRNNFLKNKIKNAFFIAGGLSNYKNIWDGNYWNRPRILPYPIFGRILFFIPWVQFDWHPAKEPYDI